MVVFMITGQYFIGALSIEQHFYLMLFGQSVHIILGRYAGALKRFFLVITDRFKVIDQLVCTGLYRVILGIEAFVYLLYPGRFVACKSGKSGRKSFVFGRGQRLNAGQYRRAVEPAA